MKSNEIDAIETKQNQNCKAAKPSQATRLVEEKS